MSGNRKLSTVVVVVLALNLLWLDAKLIGDKNREIPGQVLPASTVACPSACVDLISGSKARSSEQVISVSASGSTNLMVWTAVSGSEFSFNKANYKGAKKIYFQVNLSTDATDRRAYARLFDVTHGVTITGSEVGTLSTTLSQVQSSELNPFSGDLTVRVELKSLNGNLVTASNPRVVVKY